MLNLYAAIRRDSDDKWLDFFDNVFKSAGWVMRQQVMVEFDPVLSPGTYVFTFDTSYFPNPDDYVITFQQVPPTVFPQTVLGELRIGGVPDDCVLSRKIGQNRLDMSPGAVGNWVLYDDNSVTPLLTYDVSDVTGGPIAPPPGAPARRTRGI